MTMVKTDEHVTKRYSPPLCMRFCTQKSPPFEKNCIRGESYILTFTNGDR